MLERGTLPYCYFDLAGGLVGSAPNVNWKIDNWKNEISDIEFEIKYYPFVYLINKIIHLVK